jgi:endothelin-converting enzyme/putative endopeptidase
MARNAIPPDQAAWSVYAKLTEENAEFLWGILEDASHPSVDRTPVQQKIGDYFAACMDDLAVQHLGAAPLKPALEEIVGLKSKKDLAALLARQHIENRGGGFLFGFGSHQDFGDAAQVMQRTGVSPLFCC